MLDTNEKRRQRVATRLSFWYTPSLLISILLAATPGVLHARTTVTKYQYNADGALVAIIEEVGGDTKTTYLTWDNFVPDADNPETGTVMVGNGNLVAYGPSPGAATQFQFDVRDRLTSYQATDLVASYDYHADGMMGSSSTDGDSLQFYYDDNQHAQVTNIYQSGADLWSGYLGNVRYLSDGSEQVLLRPRKDMASTYDAQDKTLQSYVYDAHGSRQNAAVRSDYDLHENPFQYTGEYRDPLWGGYYLRARWYHPDLPIFLSRDPMVKLNRYGYGAGNPVMHVDPSGMSFFHSLGSALKAANTFLNKGTGGIFARIFLAPLMGALAIASDPAGFWKQITTDKDGIDIFLAAGVATELFSMGFEGFGFSAVVRNLSLKARFTTRLLVDSGLAIGQSVAAGADRGFHHFDWKGFADNLELSAGGLAYSRGVLGEGYNPYTLKGEDVVKLVKRAGDDKFLIFRERTQGYRPLGITSPLTEKAKISLYHERIIAVSKDFSMANEVVVDSDTGIGFRKVKFKGVSFGSGETAKDLAKFLESSNSRFQLVGEATATKEFKGARGAFRSGNPRNFPSPNALKFDVLLKGKAEYSLFTNNCHHHAQALLKSLDMQ